MCTSTFPPYSNYTLFSFRVLPTDSLSTTLKCIAIARMCVCVFSILQSHDLLEHYIKRMNQPPVECRLKATEDCFQAGIISSLCKTFPVWSVGWWVNLRILHLGADMCTGLLVIWALCLPDFNLNHNRSTISHKISQNSITIRSVVPEFCSNTDVRAYVMIWTGAKQEREHSYKLFNTVSHRTVTISWNFK